MGTGLLSIVGKQTKAYKVSYDKTQGKADRHTVQSEDNVCRTVCVWPMGALVID